MNWLRSLSALAGCVILTGLLAIGLAFTFDSGPPTPIQHPPTLERVP